MAKASTEQIVKLEREHKGQFVDLVLANKLFLSLLPKIAGKSKTSKEYLAVLALGKKIAQLVGSWYKRQLLYEQRAGIPKVPKDLFTYFLNPKTQDKVIAQAKAYLVPGGQGNQILSIYGMGIVPLIVWGVLALIAAFTAYEITDQLTTTAEEKADLLKQTQATLKDLNITGQQAANIITDTQQQATEGSGVFSGVGSIMKFVPWAIGLWAVNEFVLKPQKNVAKG